MLARKYRAMRNSGGGSNTAAIAPSSSVRLNNVKRPGMSFSNAPSFKIVPEIPQSEYIAEKRVKQYICNGNTNVTPTTKSCTNSKTCDVHKNMSIFTQNDYVENALPAKCVINQTKKPRAENVC